MKKQLLLLIALMAILLPAAAARTYDFKEGVLYYSFTSDSTVEVAPGVPPGYTSPYRGDIVIPETVTHEGTEYTITRVGDFAFYGSYSLTSIVIPNTVTYIGTSSFLRCVSLTSIDIPNSVTHINVSAFSECRGLKHLYIPSSVTNITVTAFAKCPGLESITVDEANPVYDSRENCNAVIETATNIMIQGCQNTVIPESVKTFGQYVFAGVTGLTSFVIPEGTTRIPNYMFMDCSNLTYVEIPNTVKSIESAAFEGCSSIHHLDIPNSVWSIGWDTFVNMTSLESFYVPSSVTYINEGCFSGCSALTSLTVASDNQYYDSRDNCNAIIETATNKLMASSQNTVIPSTVTAIGYSAFSGNVMTSIDVPNNVTSIERYAFGHCPNLTQATLPDSITTIEEATFYQCEMLQSITIPALVTSIGDNGFRLCYALNQVVSMPIVPPSLTQYTFAESYGATLFVPNESVEAYRAHEFWGKFSHIVPFIGGGPGDVDGDGSIGINDVTSIIDMVLNGGDDIPAYYDMDGDGTIGINDVTTILDMLLAHN